LRASRPDLTLGVAASVESVALATATICAAPRLRAHIANLRRKIEPAEGRHYIQTDPGVGYRLAA
jgi:hypothetical protein